MNPLLAKNLPGNIGQLLGRQHPGARVLSHHQLVQARLQLPENPANILIPQHGHHPHQPSEIEITFESLGQGARPMWIMGRIKKHRRCGPNPLQPPRRLHRGKPLPNHIKIQAPAGTSPKKRLNRGQRHCRIMGLMRPRKRQENIGILATKPPKSHLLAPHRNTRLHHPELHAIPGHRRIRRHRTL